MNKRYRNYAIVLFTTFIILFFTIRCSYKAISAPQNHHHEQYHNQTLYIKDGPPCEFAKPVLINVTDHFDGFVYFKFIKNVSRNISVEEGGRQKGIDVYLVSANPNHDTLTLRIKQVVNNITAGSYQFSLAQLTDNVDDSNTKPLTYYQNWRNFQTPSYNVSEDSNLLKINNLIDGLLVSNKYSSLANLTTKSTRRLIIDSLRTKFNWIPLFRGDFLEDGESVVRKRLQIPLRSALINIKSTSDFAINYHFTDEFPEPNDKNPKYRFLWCRNGFYVNASLLCDRYDDCGDGTDESNENCAHSIPNSDIESLRIRINVKIRHDWNRRIRYFEPMRVKCCEPKVEWWYTILGFHRLTTSNFSLDFTRVLIEPTQSGDNGHSMKTCFGALIHTQAVLTTSECLGPSPFELRFVVGGQLETRIVNDSVASNSTNLHPIHVSQVRYLDDYQVYPFYGPDKWPSMSWGLSPELRKYSLSVIKLNAPVNVGYLSIPACLTNKPLKNSRLEREKYKASIDPISNGTDTNTNTTSTTTTTTTTEAPMIDRYHEQSDHDFDNLRCYARQFDNSKSRRELRSIKVKFHYSGKSSNSKLYASTERSTSLHADRLPSGTPIVCQHNVTRCVQLRAFILDPVEGDDIKLVEGFDSLSLYEILELSHQSDWVSATVRMLLQLDGLTHSRDEE